VIHQGDSKKSGVKRKSEKTEASEIPPNIHKTGTCMFCDSSLSVKVIRLCTYNSRVELADQSPLGLILEATCWSWHRLCWQNQ